MTDLQLLVGEGVQAEVHALAPCLIPDQALEALRTGVSDVVRLEPGEGVQQELAFGRRAHRREDLQ